MKTRFPHQVEAAAFALSRGSAGFFMRMRCGKTLACIDAINRGRLRDAPALIIAPVSVLASWENELIDDGVPRDEIVVVRARPGWRPERVQRQLFNPRGRWFLINFEMVKRTDALGCRRRLLPALDLPDWETVVVDESYRIAGDENKVVEYLHRFTADPSRQRRFILSGAPASESPLDLAAQYVFLDGHYFGCRSAGEYRAKYWQYDDYTYRWNVRDPAHLDDVLAYVRRSAYTTTLEDLGLGGVKLYRIDRVELAPEQRAALDWLRTATTYPAKNTGATKILDPLVRCTFEARIAAGFHPITGAELSDAKAVHAANMWRDKPAPTLVLSRFLAPIQQAAGAFTAAGARVRVITGATVPADREEIRQAFQAGDLDVVVAQVLPVKMGLDFSRADRLVYLSNSFSQDDRAQTEDRAQHGKRTTPYEIVDICADGTHDEIFTRVLTIKKENAILYVRAVAREIVNGER